MEAERGGLPSFSDDEVMNLLLSGTLPAHRLEKELGDGARAVRLRRRLLEHQLNREEARVCPDSKEALSKLPFDSFDTKAFYEQVDGANCESVVGYVPIPVGIVGPLLLNGRELMVPMATTEGALLASTNRGCRAVSQSGGAKAVVTSNGMTRAPLVVFDSAMEAAEFKNWVDDPTNLQEVAAAFNSTTRYGRLSELKAVVAGRNVYIRFKCTTGDAMGMNMITKGVHEALQLCQSKFPSMRVLALSGNFCTDKKPSSVNWTDGRGKSVVAEAFISKSVVESVLKTDADALVDLNTRKNLIGSAMAGSVGGFNAHASNVVTAIYLATGQDCAQNVESSNCITLIEKDTRPGHEGGIVASVTMPSIEVGTVGGGTSLPAQAASLGLLGVQGAATEGPGQNAEQLSRVVAASVLAGELSLMSALTTNDLLSSHMKLNRKPVAAEASSSSSSVGAPAGKAASTSSNAAATGRRAPLTKPGAPMGAAGGLGASPSTLFHSVHASSAGRPGTGASPPQLLSQPPLSGYGTAHSPGRRFFAATSARALPGSPESLGFETRSGVASADRDWEPRLPVP